MGAKLSKTRKKQTFSCFFAKNVSLFTPDLHILGADPKIALKTLKLFPDRKLADSEKAVSTSVLRF